MELHQIYYFLKVAARLNMTRAADELRVSQPSLSRQIKMLEEELDVLLFERVPQGLRLTPAGAALQAHLEGLVERLEQTRRIMEPYATGVRGRLTIGCVPSLSAHFLPAALADFLRAYPSMETAVHVASTSADIFRQIHDGAIDIGICVGEDLDLAQVFLFTEPLLAAIPSALDSFNEAVALDRLQELPYITTPPACTIRQKIEKVTNGRINRSLEVEQVTSALQFVAQGLGITVVPASLGAHSTWNGVRFLPLDPPVSQLVYAFWRPGSFIEATHPLLDCLREHGSRLARQSVS